MNARKLINILNLLLSLLASVAAVQQVYPKMVEIVPSRLAYLWPLPAALAALLTRVVPVLEDWFDDGIINGSSAKKVAGVIVAAALVGFLFSGCAVTARKTFSNGWEVEAKTGVTRDDVLPLIKGYAK